MNNYLTLRQKYSIGTAVGIIVLAGFLVWDNSLFIFDINDFKRYLGLGRAMGENRVALPTITSESPVFRPSFAYQHDSEFNETGVNGLVAIDGYMQDCGQRIADVIVDKVKYNAGKISGFITKRPDFDFIIGSEADHFAMENKLNLDMQKLIYKGAHLIVVYQVCGSGGFTYPRDIFKWDALNNR